MFFKLIAVLVVLFLLFMAYMRFPQPPPRQTPPVMRPYDNQFDVFRDMEPQTQTRTNPWMGFLQEDVYKNRAGPIGNFSGTVDNPKRSPTYMVT